MSEETFPDRLRIRDTRLHDDMGGAGQRIYTTAGQGYTKVEYVRADLHAALRAEVERLTGLYNGRMSDLHAAQDREVALQTDVERTRYVLDEAIHRIEDMLEDDDGQAFKEAGKFLLRIKGHDHES